MQTCDFSIIASWLLLDLHVGEGTLLRLCCVLLEHLSIWMLLGDCFCKIIICLYCFFCMYYFNVVHVFYIMRNSPSCDIFYCIIILKAICLIPWKLRNWNIIYKKTLYRLYRYKNERQMSKRVISKNVSWLTKNEVWMYGWVKYLSDYHI